MKEDFLHYIWKYKLFELDKLETDTNLPVIINNVGTHNFDSGPDFFNARIKIGDIEWAGNIEIHINSSDWYKHKHQFDPAYNNVILHVVYNIDSKVYNSKNNEIPQLKIKVDNRLINNYNKLLASEKWIPCQDEIKNVDSIYKYSFLNKLLIERLEHKVEFIEDTLKFYNYSWNDCFYVVLMRNFGFKTNSDPFTLLANSLPLNCLIKHKNDLLRLEALLFGQAGFLNDDFSEVHPIELQKEYTYLKRKYKLSTLDKSVWKFSKMRPPNFPTIRIAQMASLIQQSSFLFSKILEITSIYELRNLFKARVSNYWLTHYNFEKKSKKIDKTMGESSIDAIIINTIVPILFLYGKRMNKPEISDKSFYFLQELAPEKNNIITKWKELGLNPENAFMSQALIQLKNEYCTHKRCLNCAIGNKVIGVKD